MSGVVLVHGSWHDAWCWEPVVDELRTRGAAPVAAVDLPFTGLDDDVATVRSAVDTMADTTGGPVVVVGHSYGGLVISHAAAPGTASHLVFIAAIVIDVGENAAAVAAECAPPTL